MSFSLPVMIRPIDVDMDIQKSTKCKFHYLTLESNKEIIREGKGSGQGLQRVVRQFIHEINNAEWDNMSFLAIYNNSDILKYNQFAEGGMKEGTEDAIIRHLINYKIDVDKVSDKDFYSEVDSYPQSNASKNIYLQIQLSMSLDSKSNRHNSQKKASNEIIEQNTNNHRTEFVLKNSDKFDIDQLDLILHLKFVFEEQYIDIIQIVITRERTTWYGAIDFGSEASQMKFKSSINMVNMPSDISSVDVDFIKTLETIQGIGSNNSGKGKNYWQEDEDIDDFLYRSIFPVKNLANIPGNFFLNNSGDEFYVEFLKLLSKTFDNQSYLPNLKLLKQLEIFQDDEDIKSLINDIKKSLFIEKDKDAFGSLIQDIYPLLMANLIALGVIFLIANKQIRLFDKNRNVDSKRILTPTLNFVIRILVPNMYQSAEIYDLTSTLQKIFIGFKSHVQNRLFLGGASPDYYDHISNEALAEKLNSINAFEFLVLAEGDAVAIERNKVDSPKFLTADRFVVIDCGKGTTDISIFKKQKVDEVMDTVYRGGFAGAGNALSKAIFDDFKEDLTHGTEPKTELLLQSLRQLGDEQIASKLNISLLMDAIKKSYFSDFTEQSNLSEYIDKFLKSEGISNKARALAELTSSLNEAIPYLSKSKWHFLQEEGVVSKTDTVLNNIIDEVIYQLKIGGVRKVKKDNDKKIIIILSGRMFKSAKIAEAFIQRIGNEFGLDTSIGEYGSTNNNKNFSSSLKLKKRCIEGGVEETPALNLNSDINGIPMFVKDKFKLIGKGTEKEILPLSITPHEFKFYYENILSGAELRDGNENNLLLNRFYLKFANPLDRAKLSSIYYIGRGFLGIQKHHNADKVRSGYLTPSYKNIHVLNDENKNRDSARNAEEIKQRYLQLLKDSFFPFI